MRFTNHELQGEIAEYRPHHAYLAWQAREKIGTAGEVSSQW